MTFNSKIRLGFVASAVALAFAALAVQAAAIASDDAAKDSAKSLVIAVDKIEGVDQSGIATPLAVAGSGKPLRPRENSQAAVGAARA
jgi:hypothetical protein